ncbi:PREDICTED: beta-glucosidase 13-like [Erythranthe guttata]|uniref:beta-glucosidase 13-like n=1 Tax=Erythranthe guttata TaxID=4155 RepID=UPI00064D7AEB|nr:PREDICTED: beta-glucosidase 13-like [Erythranthe guttata]|eukprot:XP_012858036.1 PREDICTED: beta-glucosidase 13-like [Erythranthe guttata]
MARGCAAQADGSSHRTDNPLFASIRALADEDPIFAPDITSFSRSIPTVLKELKFNSLHRKRSLFIWSCDDFRNFAELCFEEFGDRIKHWITVNEPYIFIICGYDGGFAGNFAPGRCSSPDNCVQGDSATEPYIAAHHMLICHASTIKLYKEKYQETQKGEIGITQVSNWMVPHSSTKLDIEAAQRALDFMYGWLVNLFQIICRLIFTSILTESLPKTYKYLHNVYGDYPEIMKSLIGNRLPNFTKEESSLLKGSFDFLGVNYYTATYASHISSPNSNITSTTDNMVHFSSDIEGVPIGDPTGVNGFYVYPEGLYELLIYTKENYNNPTIYITETGIGDQNNGDVENGIKDVQRIDFYNRHIRGVLQAIQQGVNVKGFFAWSFLDNFEWVSGYTIRFGLCYVDHENGLKRIPKQSALWFKNWLTMK